MKAKFKRYCKGMQLKNDPILIEEYKKLHSMEKTWPEITSGMKKVGIIDMEIYISGTTLFMIMDTKADFDHDKAMTELATLPRQAEWEALVSQFQKTHSNASVGEKWKIVERIYKLDQKQNYHPEDGYVEEIEF